MSFRCTNNLVGTIRHRLALEAVHRQLVRRTFTGRCNGIEVTCSAYGTVLSIREVDTLKSATLYRPADQFISNNTNNNNINSVDKREHTGVSDDEENSSANNNNNVAVDQNAEEPNTNSQHKTIDYEKLAESIQVATWQAIRQIQACKQQAHFRSLRDNNTLLSTGSIHAWYEHDSTNMYPRPFDALKQELATPWMQAVRFGKHNAWSLLSAAISANNVNNNENNSGENNKEQRMSNMELIRNSGISVLCDEDTKLNHIPIGSLHPYFTPSLIHLEQGREAHGANNENNEKSDDQSEISNNNVDSLAVLREYAWETSRDEQLFWDRVELIRRGQLATLPKQGKRAYNDSLSKISNSSTVAMNAVKDKIELRFTRE